MEETSSIIFIEQPFNVNIRSALEEPRDLSKQRWTGLTTHVKTAAPVCHSMKERSCVCQESGEYKGLPTAGGRQIADILRDSLCSHSHSDLQHVSVSLQLGVCPVLVAVRATAGELSHVISQMV